MAWYDFFSNFYDASIEQYYAAHRPLAAKALALYEGSIVLDCPCGTGQSFDVLRTGIGTSGALIGADISKGMLDKARARGTHQGWTNLHLIQKSAASLDRNMLPELPRGKQVDRLHIFLGMSVFTDMDQTFRGLWAETSPHFS